MHYKTLVYFIYSSQIYKIYISNEIDFIYEMQKIWQVDPKF